MLTTCRTRNLSDIKISLWDSLNTVKFREHVVRGIWVPNVSMITVRNKIGWSLE